MEINNGPFVKVYLELLIMGGNLGTLSGDIDYAKGCNQKALELSQLNNLYFYELRAARKYADLSINDGKYDQVIEFLLQYVNLDNLFEINCYQLYLLVSLGEAYSLK